MQFSILSPFKAVWNTDTLVLSFTNHTTPMCLHHLWSGIQVPFQLQPVRPVELNRPCVKGTQSSTEEAQTHTVTMCEEYHEETMGEQAVTHPTVLVTIKYLGWQRVPLSRFLFWGDVFVHPLPLFFWHCDVHLLKFYLVGFQKSNHILLLLLYL